MAGVNRRRIVVTALMVLLCVVIVGALTPTEKPFEAGPSTSAGPAAGSRGGEMVEASLPRTRDVRARVGDVVSLTVRASSSDIVELPGLAVQTPVDAGEPAQLVFVADRPGRFPVRLRYADDAVGMLQLDG